MKIFSSEYIKDYSSYTFSYANYCIREQADRWSDIYELGFLPYTGNTQMEDDIFYMARSLRIDLKSFTSSSENRRVKRKFEDMPISVSCIPIVDFDINDSDFIQFCLSYANERFSGGSMPPERFSYVISRGMATHILQFSFEDEPLAYVLCCMDQEMLHYWFAFFDLSWLEKGPIGKWVMLSSIEWAHAQDLLYVYLGTCYDTKSLYKVRDFKSTQYFDGREWRTDTAILKEWCKTDQSPLAMDRFKINHL